MAADQSSMFAKVCHSLVDRRSIERIGRFGVVGVLGLLVDTAAVYSLAPTVGVYAAGILAYPIAATFNWAINRVWTFRDRLSAENGAIVQQWVAFLAANSLGFALNRSAYLFLVYKSSICYENPIIAVAFGAIAGMVANYALSSKFVFR